MAIESVTCPSCGAADIQIDTTCEYSSCSFCGSTLKTKDVLHLDTDSMALGKLKRNAQRSYEVRQYKNAIKDWMRATELDRTDYESYWGLVRCRMVLRPLECIRHTDTDYSGALAYAPLHIKAKFKETVDAHNARARNMLEQQCIAAQQMARLERMQKILFVLAVAASPWALFMALLQTAFWPVFAAAAVVSWMGWGLLSYRVKKK